MRFKIALIPEENQMIYALTIQSTICMAKLRTVEKRLLRGIVLGVPQNFR